LFPVVFILFGKDRHRQGSGYALVPTVGSSNPASIEKSLRSAYAIRFCSYGLLFPASGGARVSVFKKGFPFH
jgi:hypothetical protein